jgi:hypothetical protein
MRCDYRERHSTSHPRHVTMRRNLALQGTLEHRATLLRQEIPPLACNPTPGPSPSRGVEPSLRNDKQPAAPESWHVDAYSTMRRNWRVRSCVGAVTLDRPASADVIAHPVMDQHLRVRSPSSASAEGAVYTKVDVHETYSLTKGIHVIDCQ